MRFAIKYSTVDGEELQARRYLLDTGHRTNLLTLKYQQTTVLIACPPILSIATIQSATGLAAFHLNRPSHRPGLTGLGTGSTIAVYLRCQFRLHCWDSEKPLSSRLFSRQPPPSDRSRPLYATSSQARQHLPIGHTVLIVCLRYPIFNGVYLCSFSFSNVEALPIVSF